MPVRSRRSSARRLRVLAAAAAALVCQAAAAQPAPGRPPAHWLKDNPFGAFYLKLRPRFEFVDIDGKRSGYATSLRTVLGFGSRRWHGFSLLAEGASVLAVGRYFDGSDGPSGRSLIADPVVTRLNQLYLDYQLPEWTTALRVGRQRVVLDDERFVGNVGWRQNEQTFDAVRFQTGLGLRQVELGYLFLDEAQRIFGDKGRSETQDFRSESHLIRAEYRGLPGVRVVGFAYLLDFGNSPRDSSNSYGTRVTGRHDLAERWQLDWSLSYAYQTDAQDNPADYRAHYAWGEAGARHERWGRLGVGYELLGSDDGEAVFATPLSTAHKFNGYADAFVDNGGPDGLRDLFVRMLPELPWKLSGELAGHWFQSDEDAEGLGWELDAQLSRPLGRHATVLAKVAWFDARSDAAPAGRVRAWLQFTLDF